MKFIMLISAFISLNTCGAVISNPVVSREALTPCSSQNLAIWRSHTQFVSNNLINLNTDFIDSPRLFDVIEYKIYYEKANPNDQIRVQYIDFFETNMDLSAVTYNDVDNSFTVKWQQFDATNQRSYDGNLIIYMTLQLSNPILEGTAQIKLCASGKSYVSEIMTFQE